MKNIKISNIIALVVLIIIAIFLYSFIKHNSETGTVKQVVPGNNVTSTLMIDKSLVEEQKYSEPDQYASFDVTYPQFKNASVEFNKKISDMVLEGIKTQKQDASANWKARYETRSPGDKISEFPTGDDKFPYNVSWSPVQVNGDFISITITTSAFSGGAHGYEVTSSFNYDVKNKKEVTLASLFPNDKNYLKTISDLSRKELETKFRKNLNIQNKEDEQNFKDTVLPMLMDGTTPEETNFSTFTFIPSEVKIYFGQYQVAPYSMGTSIVVIPRK